jgi:MFS family permease
MTADVPTLDQRRRAVRFSNIGHFYSHLFMLLYPTVVLALEEEFNRSYGELLALALPGFVLFGIAALPAGWLGDKWSAPNMFTIFFLGTGAAAILTGLATTALELGAGLTLIGLMNAIYHPVGTSLIVRHAANRARALAANGVWGTMGIALAAVISGALTDVAGWRAAFVVPGVVCLATGVLFRLLVAREALETGGARTRLDPGVSRRQAVHGLAILSITILCIGLIAQSLQVGMPKMFAVRVTLMGDGGLSGTGVLVTGALMLAALGQIIGGRLAERYSLKFVYLSMYALLAPVALLAAGWSEFPLVAASAAMMLLLTASLPAENCLVARFCPAAWHATAYGAKFVLGLGVSSLALPMMGAIYDGTGGFYWLYVALGGIAALVAAIAAFLPSGAAAAAALAPSAAE